MTVEKKTDVFGVGNALVDILALVDDDFVREHDLGKGSMMLVDTEKQGHLLNQLEGQELKLRSGGSAANSMIAIALSGGTGFYVGKVAKDIHGEFYRQDLLEAGIHFNVHPARGDGPTGTCLVLTTPDAERTMCTNLGVSTHLAKEDIDLDRLATCRFSYIEGYLWDGDDPRQASVTTMEKSVSLGIPVAFTFSDMFLVERFGDDFRRVMKDYCQVVFCNADEVRRFLGEASLADCARRLGELVTTAFITDGANGCHVVHRGEIQHIPGFAVQAVDTVGAGDAFAGGVLYGLTNGLDVTSSARWGNYVASRVVQIYGARLDEPLRDQVSPVLGR